jgi:NAD(P)H-flavin reductase
VRSPHDIPLTAEIEEWMNRGVQVHLCLSRPEAGDARAVLPRATRSEGYVQDALARARDGGLLGPSTLVLAAGPEQMLSALRSSTIDFDVVTNA